MVATSLYMFMGKMPPVSFPENTIHDRSPFFIVVMIQNTIMSHMTSELQINHVSGTSFNPWHNRVMVVNLLAVIFMWIADLVSRKTINIAFPLNIVLICTLLANWHYLFNCVYELSKELKIRVFCVKPIIKKVDAPELYEKIDVNG